MAIYLIFKWSDKRILYSENFYIEHDNTTFQISKSINKDEKKIQ